MYKSIHISWYGKHFGEEPPLVGLPAQGAGAIFFSGCNLKCVFCQNYQISQQVSGNEYSVNELANIMLQLQAEGAVNIDLVSPTIWWKGICESIRIAKNNGLEIPIIWNTNAYEEVSMIEKLEGLVDIYLPDFKYSISETGKKYSGISNYANKAFKAIQAMVYQVGKLKTDNNIAYRGVIVRHLVLPNNLENSLQALEMLATLSPKPHVSLMSQYNPMYKSRNYPELERLINTAEWERVKNKYEELDFYGWEQDLSSSSIYNPDFNLNQPFDNQYIKF
jgi:putative pyruvate formate lyase activating enzyme